MLLCERLLTTNVLGAPLNKLTMIASTLNFPEKFFLGELLPELDRDSVEFRSYRGTPAKERKASLAHAKLGIGLMTWIKSKFSLPSLGIPSFNGFATEFLFPRVAQYEYCVKNPDLKQIMTYKGAFGSSAFATVHALHRSGLLTDWAYRKMCVELSRQGLKSAEPESRMSYEKSRVFSVVLDSLVSRKTGFRTIADAMSFPLSSVHSLMMADSNTVEGNCE